MSKKIEVAAARCGETMAIVNGRDDGRARFILAFGAYGATKCMVWADHLEDALDACADWIEEHTPGLFCDAAVAGEYERARAEGLSEEEALAAAAVDMTLVGNGHYLASWEWTIVVENPNRAEVLALLGRE